MSETIVTGIGWIGFIFCTTAYLLLNLKVLKFDGIVYQILNIIGGIGLVVSAVYFDDNPNIAANIIWVLIALYGVATYSRRRSKVRRGRVVQPK